MIEVHLYGKMRRYGQEKEISHPSVVRLEIKGEHYVDEVLQALGIPPKEPRNVFINGRYKPEWHSEVIRDGDRLGLFGSDMALLYI
ncbi:MAG: MoaD/ThiS family protein [Chloroflexi bacterium]|nr:MoaD/ThiS family protein [Chloroflexota bacterium]